MTDFNKIKSALNLTDDEIGTHETDLHVKWTKERENYFTVRNWLIAKFRSAIDNTMWFEVPFYLMVDKINEKEVIYD